MGLGGPLVALGRLDIGLRSGLGLDSAVEGSFGTVSFL